jgi:hypothetical protein
MPYSVVAGCRSASLTAEGASFIQGSLALLSLRLVGHQMPLLERKQPDSCTRELTAAADVFRIRWSFQRTTIRCRFWDVFAMIKSELSNKCHLQEIDRVGLEYIADVPTQFATSDFAYWIR